MQVILTNIFNFLTLFQVWFIQIPVNLRCFAVLYFYFRDTEMIVKVQGPRPENILFLVHEVFEALINESFHGVKYDFSVPCPDCNNLVRYSTWFGCKCRHFLISLT